MQHRNYVLNRQFGAAVLFAVLCCATQVFGQTTAFTYQGRLTNAGSPATGNYDLQFELYDALSEGTQVGPTLTQNPVAINAGGFTVMLDFGEGVFDGAERYLEIGVRTAGSGQAYTILSPRQAITSTPYSVRSMNAAAADGLSVACVNCVTSSQIETVDGAQVTGAIPVESVPLGSGNYIQNAVALRKAGKNALQQAASFAVDGDGAIGGTLTVSGRIGIGTDIPATKLEVFTPINDYGFMHTGQLLPTLPRIKLATYVGANGNLSASGAFLGTVSDDSLHFFTNSGLGSMTITPAGTVGIGTPAPAVPLHVRLAWARLRLESTQNDTWPSTEYKTPGREWHVGVGGPNVPNDVKNKFYIRDHTIGAERLLIDNNGNVSLGVLQITGGSDLAEHFEVIGAAKPGMLVAIDPENAGKLSVAHGAYNRRVAGVISGAKNLSPGMVLPDLSASEKSQPIALSGRVWVYCDATTHPIKPGDLLTTSNTPGHAMKVTNYAKAQGAIIGKAMSGLKSGRGLALVLVSLQ